MGWDFVLLVPVFGPAMYRLLWARRAAVGGGRTWLPADFEAEPQRPRPRKTPLPDNA